MKYYNLMTFLLATVHCNYVFSYPPNNEELPVKKRHICRPATNDESRTLEPFSFRLPDNWKNLKAKDIENIEDREKVLFFLANWHSDQNTKESYMAAAEFYESSDDNLSAALCLVKAGKLNQALGYLKAVKAVDFKSANEIFLKAYINYKTGFPLKAKEYINEFLGWGHLRPEHLNEMHAELFNGLYKDSKEWGIFDLEVFAFPYTQAQIEYMEISDIKKLIKELPIYHKIPCVELIKFIASEKSMEGRYSEASNLFEIAGQIDFAAKAALNATDYSRAKRLVKMVAIYGDMSIESIKLAIYGAIAEFNSEKKDNAVLIISKLKEVKNYKKLPKFFESRNLHEIEKYKKSLEREERGQKQRRRHWVKEQEVLINTIYQK